MKIITCSPELCRKIRYWIIFSVILSALLILFSPLEYLLKFYGYEQNNGCPLLTFTGLPCPACGLGRSFVALITFDMHHLFYYNPVGPFFFIIIGNLITFLVILSFQNKTIKIKPSLLQLWYIPVSLLIIGWILNILFGHHN